MRIAVIGCGYWGKNHVKTLGELGYLHGACDSDFSKIEFLHDYPMPESINYKALLGLPEIDAIVIATPANTHYRIAMDALRAGKHVLVEKPMALSVEEVGDIGSLAKEKSVVAMVGHTFLYSPAVRYVKQLVDSGELGNILYVYAQRLNWGIVRPDVNALWSLGVHDISIIQYWLGDLSEPASISKTGVDFIKSGIEDVVFLNIVYPDNLMINIHVSWLDHHKTRRITVVGTRKMVVYDNMAEKKISIFDNGDVAQPEIEQKEPLKEEIKHFIDCIANGSKCLTDTEHAKKVIKTLSRAK